MFSSYGELSTEVYDLSKPIGHSFGDVSADYVFGNVPSHSKQVFTFEAERK